MTVTDDDLLDEEGEDESGLIPYAPDFTPATLGKTIGDDKILKWLLDEAASAGTKPVLHDVIADKCLSHIQGKPNRRDMASHVVQGLRNYQLVDVDDENKITLSQAAEAIRAAKPADRDIVFAQHILTACGGFRVVEAIQRYEVRGSHPTMELLNEELGRHPTEKSISSIRAWLARAGVMSAKGPYAVIPAGLAAVVGHGALQMLGLDPAEVEFLLAARVLTAQTGSALLEAPDVRMLAEARAPHVRIPSKALGSFVRRLMDQGLVDAVKRKKGKGGTRVNLKLTMKGTSLTDDQIRLLLEQSAAGYALSELGTFSDALADLAKGTAEQRGHAGEKLAVHLCLMLGLRVVGWRDRLPVEVDLTAERDVGLTYQRWHVQVKNIDGDLSADRVDREIGAAAGTGATHLLFVVPRGGVTGAARAEAMTKSRLTPMHIFWLTADTMATANLGSLLRHLEGQQAVIVREKRNEAERRERLP
ncbi:MAG: hypothetical protein IT383_10525 [Deltaproteobacteria bacterium]|nr:hypothetical protein [Deltaproteobacteria bacterium]